MLFFDRSKQSDNTAAEDFVPASEVGNKGGIASSEPTGRFFKDKQDKEVIKTEEPQS